MLLPLPATAATASTGALPQPTKCNGVTLTQRVTYGERHRIDYDFVASAPAYPSVTFKYFGTVSGVYLRPLPLCPNGRIAYRVSVLGNFAKLQTGAGHAGRLLPETSIEVDYDDLDRAQRAVLMLRCGALQVGC